MAIIKHKIDPKNGYTVLDNTFIKDPSISFGAKGLMATLYSLPPNWNVTAKGLSTLSSNCYDSVRSILKELVDAGYLIKEKIKGERGRFAGFRYFIGNTTVTTGSVDVSPQTVNPAPVNPATVNPVPVNPATVFPEQLNTNELNTDGSNKEESNTDVSIIFSAGADGSGKRRARWREKKEKFTPPGVEEVREYCESHGLSVDAEHFVNYYSANGWRFGKSKMKDWKSAVVCWSKYGSGAKAEERREKKKVRNYGNFDTADFFRAAVNRTYGELKIEG